MLLYPVLTPGGIALYMPLIRRAEYPGVHSGQIGLPGGRLEDGEGFLEAALRECHEEIGVAPAAVEIIGELATLYVPPSNFEIHPFVGYVPFRPTWQPDPTEVAEVIEMPVSRLMDDGAKGEEVIARAEVAFHIHYYMVGAHKVWGATAIMLGELESRLRHALG
jgi:8-oxo-dGTP pyrophosphatase MutT (NUDIX family)